MTWEGPESRSRPHNEGRGKPLRLDRSQIELMSAHDVHDLVHALQVHQAELEHQNAALRQAQDELEAARARLEDLYDNAPVGYLSLDAQGCIRGSNATASALLDTDRAALFGRRLSDFVAPDSQDVLYLRWKEVFRSGGGNIELHMLRRGSHRFYANLDIKVYPRESDAEARVTLSDIDERERRQVLERRVQQLEKHDSLGAMAGGVAHDFNNLLTAILGHLELADERLSSSQEVAHHIACSRAAAVEAADISGQLLAYARKGTFNLITTSLSTLVNDAVSMLSSVLPANVTLNTRIQERVAMVDADVVQLRRALLNLVSNASEAYDSRPGVVIVSLGMRDCDREFWSTPPLEFDLPPGQYVALSVTDRGCGINQDIIGRVFDPFFSTKVDGRGLGLAGVMGIVRGHGGAIKVETSPNEGSTFHIFLPPSSKPAAPRTHTRKPRGDLKAWTGCALIVDDEPAVLRIGKLMLESLGFEVESVGAGVEAEERFRREPDRYSIVLIDLLMPGMRGEQLMENVRAIRDDVPILLCTGCKGDRNVEALLGLPGVALLSKPYTRTDLVHKLENLLRPAN